MAINLFNSNKTMNRTELKRLKFEVSTLKSHKKHYKKLQVKIIAL